MYLGYLLTAESFAQNEIFTYTSVSSRLEEQYNAIHCHSSRFALALYSHPQLPLERRMQHTRFEEQKCTLVIVGRVYYTYGENETSDALPETLIQLYLKHGASFFDYLSGEFVCLLIDEKKNTAFLACDHIGTIPCYYVQGESALFFSSHAPALSEFCRDKKMTDAFVEKQFLSYAPGYHVTPFESLKKIMPGSYIEASPSGVINHIYWNPDKLPVQQNIHFQQAKDGLKNLLYSALEFRMDRAYTTGTHISGGLDSALLTDWCRNYFRDQVPFQSFSWTPSEKLVPLRPENDERQLINSFCALRNIHVQYTDLRTEDYMAYLGDGVYPMDFPYERLVQENATQHGVNLLVSAWGADEFAGIDNHAVRLYLFRRARFMKFFGRNSARGFKNQLIYLLNEGLLPRRRKPYAKWRTSSLLRKFLKSRESMRAKDLELYKSPRKMMLGTLRFRHLAERCEYWYNSGHLNGIQYTYPFLDKRLLEFCLQIPEDIFTEGNFEKPLIRALIEELPDGALLLEKQLPDPILFEQMRRVQFEAVDFLIPRINEYAAVKELTLFDHAAFNNWLSGLNLKEEEQRDRAHYILSYLAAAFAAIRTFAGRPNHERQ